MKQPWLISNAQQALAVAALWDVWEGGESPLLSCTLVTTAAAPAFEPWHRRMPLVLARDEYDRWLDCSHSIDPADSLFRPALKLTLRLQALPRAIGNARNKDWYLFAGATLTYTIGCDNGFRTKKGVGGCFNFR